MTGIAWCGVGLDAPGRLPAVHHRQAHVHQDEVGLLARGHLHALCAVDRDDDLEAVAHQPPRQHVAVHLVVFDQQDLCHCVLRRSGGFATLIRRLSAFERRASADSAAPRLGDRLRALGQDQHGALGRRTPARSRSSPCAVSTTTGTSSSNSVCLRRVRRNSKPSISGIIRSSRISAGCGLRGKPVERRLAVGRFRGFQSDAA